uniref:Reverse transcriptase zinc-binding domain-containing protein n=1 Tax=Manihot esculenta TaxID=3983 RepID=A0A2C9VWQ3_MANES
MLGKQRWRMLTQTNTLLPKMFKSKYFPKRNLLDAILGFNSSFIWRGMVSSLSILRRGVRWRVSNGEKINIAKGIWLPKDDSFMVEDGAMFVGDNMRVKDLFVKGSRRWNVMKIMKLFSFRDIQCILDIPLSVYERERIL